MYLYVRKVDFFYKSLYKYVIWSLRQNYDNIAKFLKQLQQCSED